MCWIYRKTSMRGDPYVYTVGFFAPLTDDSGFRWEPVDDFKDEKKARELVHYLNGGMV